MKRDFSIKRRTPAIPPRGFTLVELVVVIGIIIFLITMTVTVVSSAVTTAREKQTKATIKKIDSLLTARMEAFTIAAKAQNLDKTDLTTVIKKKTLFKAGFPQTLQEAFNAADTAGDPTASSEALYQFLFHSESYGSPPEGEDAFKDAIQDTDGDERPEFVDGWGRPLRFYRWPTRLIRPGPPPGGAVEDPQSYSGTYPSGNYAIEVYRNRANWNGYFGEAGHEPSKFFASLPPELDKDPDDPLGRLNPVSLTDMAAFENNFHTPETWSMPLIVSAGQDGILGLYEPNDNDNFGHLAQPKQTEIGGILDNFTNRNLQP